MDESRIKKHRVSSRLLAITIKAILLFKKKNMNIREILDIKSCMRKIGILLVHHKSAFKYSTPSEKRIHSKTYLQSRLLHIKDLLCSHIFWSHNSNWKYSSTNFEEEKEKKGKVFFLLHDKFYALSFHEWMAICIEAITQFALRYLPFAIETHVKGDKLNASKRKRAQMLFLRVQ